MNLNHKYSKKWIIFKEFFINVLNRKSKNQFYFLQVKYSLIDCLSCCYSDRDSWSGVQTKRRHLVSDDLQHRPPHPPSACLPHHWLALAAGGHHGTVCPLHALLQVASFFLKCSLTHLSDLVNWGYVKMLWIFKPLPAVNSCLSCLSLKKGFNSDQIIEISATLLSVLQHYMIIFLEFCSWPGACWIRIYYYFCRNKNTEQNWQLCKGL